MYYAIEEATKFVETISSLYDENEGYAPGLRGHEKAMTDIKLFSAGSDVTVLEFLGKFGAYCTGTKKVKAYKQTTICLRLYKPRRLRSTRTLGLHEMFSQRAGRDPRANRCNQFLEELYRERGELLDKAMSLGRTLALQIPVACSNGSIACFYSTPLEREVEAVSYPMMIYLMRAPG